MSDLWWVILGGAVLTYATRIGGYLAIVRFKTLHPRVEQALEAVPAAVLVTIGVPGFVDGSWLERGVLVAAMVAALYVPHLVVIFAATGFVALTRFFGI